MLISLTRASDYHVSWYYVAEGKYLEGKYRIVLLRILNIRAVLRNRHVPAIIWSWRYVIMSLCHYIALIPSKIEKYVNFCILFFSRTLCTLRTYFYLTHIHFRDMSLQSYRDINVLRWPHLVMYRTVWNSRKQAYLYYFHHAIYVVLQTLKLFFDHLTLLRLF